MSEFFPCWILKPDLFFSFFKKYPAARKLLAAALTGFPPKRLVSVLWYPGSLYEGGFCLQVRPDNRASFILELVPVFSGQLPFAVSESPPENASFTVPRGNFLQVFLTFQEANQQNPFFYGNFDASSLPFSRRVLNLSALQPSLSAFPDLYAFSRFLLVRHSLRTAFPRPAFSRPLFCLADLGRSSPGTGATNLICRNTSFFPGSFLRNLCHVFRQPAAAPRKTLR